MDFYNVLLAKKTNRVLQYGSLYERLFETWINRARQILKDLPTGAISTVNDAAELPLNALKVSVEAQQDLHGYDHPWAGGTGKNVIPMTVSNLKALNITGTWSSDTYSLNGITFTVNTDNGENVTGIKVNGTASAQAQFNLSDTNSALPLTDGASYTLTGCPSGGSTVDKYWLTISGGLDDVGSGITFTANTGTYYGAKILLRNGATASNLIFYPMLRLSSASADFEPYSNICPISGWDSGEITVCDDIQNPTQTKTYTQQFPTTIYGAEWDVTDGDMKKKEQGLQISQTAWIHNTTYGYHLFMSNTLLNKALNYNFTCECYKTVLAARDQLQDGDIGTYNTQFSRNIFAIRDDRFDNVTDFINAMGNYKIKYELTESSQETIDLSPLSIRMLEGTNNIFADCGEVIEGEYWAEV